MGASAAHIWGGPQWQRRSRAGRCRGLCRYRDLLDLKVHVRIPALEDGAQFPVERPHSRLYHKWAPSLDPLLLRFLPDPLADPSVNGDFTKPVRVRLAVWLCPPEVR